MKIDLICSNNSLYSVLNHFTRKFYEAFIRKGYQARLIEDIDLSWGDLIKNPADLIIGFNGIPSKDNNFICNIVLKPYLNIIVDPFYRFFGAVLNPYSITGCDDLFCTLILKQYGYEKTIFIPHAVEKDFINEEEKHFDVSFLATYIDYKTRKENWKKAYSTRIWKAMEEFSEWIFLQPSKSFVEEGFKTFLDLHQKFPEEPFDVFAVLSDLELYVKGKERTEILKNIKSIDVHLFGDSVDTKTWKDEFSDQSNIIIHPSVDYQQSLDIVKQSRLILNASLKNQGGGHERIFSAFAAGSLPLTHRNPFLDQYFTADLDILYYETPNFESIESTLEAYIKDEDKRLFVVTNGKSIVMKEHTWDNRVEAVENQVFPLINR
jgi:glycosyltransferase involved in cell wall biosynthesis